ncbi:hypothetical protein, partial [Actinomadura sp. HBU206391]|uniref:hypothetical protein n=1 Tax=Actinomadura sp. HBU206391 TaxID=2731692 RepID=UPI00165090B7
TARTMAGKTAAREEGRWIGTRRPPLGYVKAPHPTIKAAWTLALDPSLSATVRTAADMLTAPDGSLLKVARWLTAQGAPTRPVPAPGAPPWSGPSLPTRS